MTSPTPPQVPGLPPRRRYTDDDNVSIRPLTEDELQDWLEDVSDLQKTVDLWDKLSGIPGLLDTRPVIEVKQQHMGPGPHPGTGTDQDAHAGLDAVDGKGQFDFDPELGYLVGKIKLDPDSGDHTEFYISPAGDIYRTPQGHVDFEREAIRVTEYDVDYSKGTTLSARRDTLLNRGWIRVGVDDFGRGHSTIAITTDSIDKPTLRRLQRLYDNDKLDYMTRVDWSAGYALYGTSEFVTTDFGNFLDANHVVIEKETPSFRVIKLNVFQNARRLAEIYFDQVTGVWRYVVAGRRVPDFRIKMGVQRVSNAIQRDLRELTAQLVNGEISRQQWYDVMRATMKQEYRAAYLAAIGGLENYDRAEVSKFGWRMRPHYRWLNNFLEELESGKQALNGFAVVRAGMYARAANAIYENERMRVAAEAGYRESRRKLGPNEEHCLDSHSRPGCVELADLGWVPMDEMIPLGEATCLCITTPESRILTADGWKNFFEISVGDLVLTHLLRWRPVVAKIVKPSHPYHRQVFIKSPTGKTVGATDTHLWLTEFGWLNSTSIDSLSSKIYTITNLIQEVGDEELYKLWSGIKFKGQEKTMPGMYDGLFLREVQRFQSEGMPFLRQSENSYPTMEKALYSVEDDDGYQVGAEQKQAAVFRSASHKNQLESQGGWPSLHSLLGGGGREKTVHLPLSSGLDFRTRGDSGWVSHPSQERRSFGRPSGESGIDGASQAREDAFWEASRENREAPAIQMRSLREDYRSSSSPWHRGKILFEEMLVCLQEEKQNKESVSDLWKNFYNKTKTNQEILFEGVLEEVIPLYDIEVADDHSFILEGLVSHNSHCLCGMEFRK